MDAAFLHVIPTGFYFLLLFYFLFLYFFFFFIPKFNSQCIPYFRQVEIQKVMILFEVLNLLIELPILFPTSSLEILLLIRWLLGHRRNVALHVYIGADFGVEFSTGLGIFDFRGWRDAFFLGGAEGTGACTHDLTMAFLYESFVLVFHVAAVFVGRDR